MSPSAVGRPRHDPVAYLDQAVSLWDSDVTEVGYVARIFTQTCLPYRDPGDIPVWQRRNGGITLSVTRGPDPLSPGALMGYPHGSMPRLLMAWMGTEAVRTGHRSIPLGESLSDFCRQLGLPDNGGRTGTVPRLREQMRRLFRAVITVDYTETMIDLRREASSSLMVVDHYDLWHSDRAPGAAALEGSYVELSARFFDEMTQRPVPIDMGALRLLRGSPMRLDIYTWLTYRMSYLRRPSTVTWDQLRLQFGSGAKTPRGQRQFNVDFAENLRRVLAVYPAKVDEVPNGIRLRPSPPHVARKTVKPALAAHLSEPQGSPADK